MGKEIQKLPTPTKQKYWSVFPGLAQLAESNPHWMKLVEAGKFEDEKAFLSLKCREIGNIDPGSLVDVFQNDTPTLATLKKYQGQEVTTATIGACLLAVNEFFGEKTNLSDSQMKMLSSLIFTEYYYMNLADLKLCIKNGLLGKYGKTYGKISPDVIMDWFSMYQGERAQAAESESIKSASQYRKQPSFIGVDLEETSEKAKAIRESLAHMFQKVEEPTVGQKVIYRSVEDWCEDTGQDAVKVKEEMLAEWTTEYEKIKTSAMVSLEQFCAFKLNKFLVDINDQKQ